MTIPSEPSWEALHGSGDGGAALHELIRLVHMTTSRHFGSFPDYGDDISNFRVIDFQSQIFGKGMYERFVKHRVEEVLSDTPVVLIV